MGEKHEGNTEEGDGSDEERVRSGKGGREWGLNLQDPRNTWQRTTVKTAETARMSPPAIARAHGKSPDLTIWVTPHQAVKTGGWGGRKTEHVGWSFVSLFFFFHLPHCSGCREEGKDGGREGKSTWMSSFFHLVSVLPGAVQFLDPSLSSSSRLPLSISCSSLLPPHLSGSFLLWLETSKPGTCLSQWKVYFQNRFKDVSVQQWRHLDAALSNTSIWYYCVMATFINNFHYMSMYE